MLSDIQEQASSVQRWGAPQDAAAQRNSRTEQYVLAYSEASCKAKCLTQEVGLIWQLQFHICRQQWRGVNRQTEDIQVSTRVTYEA